MSARPAFFFFASALSPYPMDTPRLDPRAARVVAWHNRHPLALRITVAQVHGMGHVAVPFFAGHDGDAPPAAPRPEQLAAAVIGQARTSSATALSGKAEAETDGSSLRERAAARAKHAAEAAAGTGHGDGAGDGAGADTAVAAAPPPAGAAVAVAVPPPPQAAAPATAAAAAGDSRAPGAKPGRLRAAFVEDFIAPISRRTAARFMARHGVALATPPIDGPLREVAVAKASPGEAVVLLYAVTAAIEDGTRRVRVLLAPGPAGAVLGPRLFDRRRIAALCVTLVGLTAAAAFALRPAPATATAATAEPSTTLVAATAASASAPHAVFAAMATTAPAPAPAPAPATTPIPTPAIDAVPQALAPASAPTPDTTPLRAEGPAKPPVSTLAAPTPRRDLRPALDDATKAAARQAVADLRATLPPAPAPAPAGPGPAPGPAPAPAPARAQASTLSPAPTQPAAAVPARTAPAVPAGGQPLFALTSRVLRTQAESEQLATAARALLAQPAGRATPLQVELMAAAADWRVVAWPFTTAADAEQARALLASRGLRVQVVDF